MGVGGGGSQSPKEFREVGVLIENPSFGGEAKVWVFYGTSYQAKFLLNSNALIVYWCYAIKNDSSKSFRCQEKPLLTDKQ